VHDWDVKEDKAHGVTTTLDAAVACGVQAGESLGGETGRDTDNLGSVTEHVSPNDGISPVGNGVGGMGAPARE
jgi:hypothetical protein